MRRKAVIAALALALSACSHQPDIVQAPVAVPCPPPPVVVRPHLPIGDLEEGSGADQIMKSFVATVEILKGYSASLEKLLDGYRPGTGGK